MIMKKINKIFILQKNNKTNNLIQYNKKIRN